MELHFSRTNGAVDDMIDSLMELTGIINHPEIVREMIIAALKAGQEGEEKMDLKLMNTTLKEMRFTSKVFAPYRGTKKVTVFGSARARPDETVYAMARLFGRKLAESGYMVITGGGPGIMQAVNEGAGPEKSFGVSIRLPFEQKINPVLEGNPRNINYKYFFNRKVAFLKEADVIALFPGGFGTLDEAMETLTLVQTGKRNLLPLVLIDEPGGTYWSQWLAFLKGELLGRGYINEMDFNLFHCVDSVREAVKVIDLFYRRYHSLRYVGDQLVIRMNSPIDPERVKELVEAFSDILVPGGTLALSDPLPPEIDEPEIAHLPRLLVDFNRKDFGRLKTLIDEINRE
ncbi:MAG: TIGR00730 family Rossman fold protein [Deltaproteobacteria bacterium]|nr:TIGR00730 family Rossman fold protein [Deltaproteobacteria bacterium]MBW2136946.1 TIGR00730 family Rossman fold protein [Deltaproteobacteria bacterium]